MSEYGYAGKILRVDLSRQTVSYLVTSDYAERLLGGRGIAAKIYWDETTLETKALSAENCLIFITGPVAGFTRFAGCRWQICGKSPQMLPESFTCANLGGSWGAWLKYAGYDGIVVTGRAEHPGYLYIDSQGNVEIRDASGLWGKTTLETQDTLHAELGSDVRTLEIGPAGENLVHFATVLASENSSGGIGLGSVMGSKQLKAIVVKVGEKKHPPAADPETLQSLAKDTFDLYTRNWEDGRQKTLTGKITACYGCIKGCSRRTYEAEGGHKFKSFCQATLVYLGPVMKYFPNGEEVYRLATRLCDKYGLDTTVMQPLINWLNLCYQAGILSDSDSGLPLSKMGSTEFIDTLIKKISYREGFGDILAQGTLKAAEYVGQESQNLFNQSEVITRASETNDYDPRYILPHALLYATEPKRVIQTLHAIAFPLRRWVNWHNGLEGAFLSTEILQGIAEDYWGSRAAVDFSTYEGKALAAKRIQDYNYAKDSLILCDMIWPIHQVQSIDPAIRCGSLESRIVSAITGRELDEADLLKIGERVFNLQRMIMLRDGWPGRKGDVLLDYLHEEPLEGVYFTPEGLAPGKDGQIISRNGMVVDRTEFEEMKSEYYTLRGWDVASGVPTKTTLEELNLGDIAGEWTRLSEKTL
jgi:aldehyde:ferredoxin oxidoreductase